jgi:hypothetical protein
MVYDISTSNKGANSVWLAERHGVMQMTTLLFRRKAQQAMKRSKSFLSLNEVHMDEFKIGTPQKKRARKKQSQCTK